MALVLLFCLYGLLVTVAAMRVPQSELSLRELERRAVRGSQSARREYDRQKLRPQLLSLQQLLILFLVLVISCWAAWTLGWLQGGIVAAGAVLTYSQVARLPFITKAVLRWYRSSEPAINEFAYRRHKLLQLVGHSDARHEYHVASRVELQEMIERAKADDISPKLRRHLMHLMSFEDAVVADVMTPVGDIMTVYDNETLGPLVLDSLYKTGHTRFPVRDSETEAVVGVLSIDDLLTIRHHETAVVREVMENLVESLGERDTLEKSVATLLSARQHLAIVKDDEGAMTGIITLDNVLETMLGEQLSSKS